MDVDKMVWCLQNGSSATKQKLMDLLSNINAVIGVEMVIFVTENFKFLHANVIMLQEPC